MACCVQLGRRLPALPLPCTVGSPGRHVKTLDDKLVERAKVQPGVQPGKTMRITEGRHSGLFCEVVRLEPKEEGR